MHEVARCHDTAAAQAHANTRRSGAGSLNVRSMEVRNPVQGQVRYSLKRKVVVRADFRGCDRSPALFQPLVALISNDRKGRRIEIHEDIRDGRLTAANECNDARN